MWASPKSLASVSRVLTRLRASSPLMSLSVRFAQSKTVAWLQKHLAVMVIVGAVLDTAVFAVQGYQIGVLQSQQTQLSHLAAHGNCWANVLDQAINSPKTHAEHNRLVREALSCRALEVK